VRARNPPGGSFRRLQLEPLETRRLLAADAGIATDAIEILEGPVERGSGGPWAGAAMPILNPLVMVELGDAVIVSADAGLWRVARDGGAAQFIAPVGPRSAFGEQPHLAVLGERAYFGYADNDGRFELWQTDGTPTGTALVGTFAGAQAGAFLNDSLVVGDTLYFIALAPGGRTLWRTDGTAAGTVRVAEIGKREDQYDYGIDLPSHMALVNGTLLFKGHDPDHGWELWTSDGTPQGTHVFVDIHEGALPPYGDFDGDGRINLTDFGIFKENFGRGALFADVDGDGLLGLAEFGVFKQSFHGLPSPRGRSSAHPSPLTVVGDEAFFFADDELHGRELWRTDGTVAGTRLVVDLRQGPMASVEFDTLAVPRGAGVVFLADDGTNGRQIWHSDGAPQGTQPLVGGLPPGSNGGSEIAVWKDLLFFVSIRDPASGSAAVWRSDGSAEGTFPLVDVVPRSNRELFQVADDFVFFAGLGLDLRGGLWRSDGTLDGSQRIAPLTAEDPRIARILGFADALFVSTWLGDGVSRLARSSGGVGDVAPVLAE
jgi:ELWxxDGT repeat protein